jgi:uncharacterized protein
MKRTALVTGASSGIVRAFSEIFAAEGYDLVLLARSQVKLEEIATELRKRYSVTATVQAKDLSQPASPGEIFETLEEQAIPVEILVNSAGFGTYGEFSSLVLKREKVYN